MGLTGKSLFQRFNFGQQSYIVRNLEAGSGNVTELTNFTLAPIYYEQTQVQKITNTPPLIRGIAIKHSTGSLEAIVSGEQIDAFSEYFNDCFTENTYRNVKQNTTWRGIYGFEQTQVKHFNKVNGAKSLKYVEVAYCQGQCGLQLPLSVMSIDHQKAQSNGEITAVFRVFRSLGLTQGAPSGHKNKHIMQIHAPKVGGGGNTQIVPRKSPTKEIFNTMGVLYFSIYSHMNEFNAMKQQAMHHYANLRPMCQPCNSRAGNTGNTFNHMNQLSNFQ